MTNTHSPMNTTSSNPWKWATFVLVGIVIGYGISQFQSGDVTKVSVTDSKPVQVSPQGDETDEETVEETGEPIEVSVDDDASLGDKDAPITMIEFSDYQCYYCNKFYQESLPLIRENYIDTGLVRLVYRDFPGSRHENAVPAAEAAECAEEQGDYWSMHDRIFDGYNDWVSLPVDSATELFETYANELGLDVVSFSTCLEDHEMQSEVLADRTEGYEEYDVYSTPTFFINGFRVIGAQPYEVWEGIFEQLLADE